MIILRKWLFIIFNISLSIAPCFAQEKLQIIATIIDQNNDPLEYCNVLLFSMPDSLLLNETICFDGRLLMDIDSAGDYCLNITSIGYDDKTIFINNSTSLLLGDIILQTSSIMLQEIIVSSRVPKIEHKQGKVEVKVSNTSLMHLPTVQDILSRAPGVRSTDSGISVIGRGVPEIYIDGRKVNSYSEVDMLQPNEIISFEIDKNPSAQYGASITSVIRVKTKRDASEGISTQLYNSSIFSRKYSNIAGIRANFVKSKFRSFIGYDYADLSNRDYIDSYEYNYLSTGDIYNNTNSTNSYDRQNYQLTIGTGYRFNPIHDVAFQYHLSVKEKNNRKSGNQAIYNDNTMVNKLNIDELGKTEDNTNIISGTYLFSPVKQHKISLTADYIFLKTSLNQLISETSDMLNSADLITYNNSSDSHAYSIKLEYDYQITEDIKFLIGARYGRSYSDTKSIINHQSGSENYDYKNNIRDDNYAFYFTFSHDLDAFGYELGLRNENSEYNAVSNGVTIQNKHESKLFPSASIYTNNLWDNFDLSLSYINKITRPVFSQLNSSRSYLNNLSYSVGNPSLKSTINHNATIDLVMFDDINIYTSYDYYQNPIILAGNQDSSDPQIIVFSPTNIDKSQEWNIGLSYNKEWKWFGVGFDGGITIPKVNIPYLDTVIKRDKKYYFLQVNSDFTATKNTYLSINFNYQSKCIDLMTDFSPSYDLSLSITQLFFKRRLSLNVALNDILRKSNSNWFDQYGYVKVGQYNNMDTRNIRMTLRFNFNNYKNVYRRNSNYEQELKRLQ